jgi:hypothetical protein
VEQNEKRVLLLICLYGILTRTLQGREGATLDRLKDIDTSKGMDLVFVIFNLCILVLFDV